MNLDNAPTKDQLRQLLAQFNDRAGHHVLWVEKNGEVHLSTVPAGLPPVQFQPSRSELQLRYEAFEKGNEYVGASAAADAEWVSQLFESLRKEWPKAKGKAEPGYVDLF
ncbi:MAG: hypothetical protein K2R98_16065 [Gemmataceae bacterium]|nr:hypothetical protein [Gemmataceae bacterium]